MGDSPQWLDSLINYKISEQGKQSPPKKSLEPPTTEHKLQFTVKDWAMLKLIADLREINVVNPSNSYLGQMMGLGNGAVSARVKRLSQMGLIHVEHSNATDTGKNNARTITILDIPPRPWEPT